MNERPLPIVHVSPARPSKRREQDWYYSRILWNAINQRGAHAGCFLVNIKRLSSIKHRTPRLLRKIIQILLGEWQQLYATKIIIFMKRCKHPCRGGDNVVQWSPKQHGLFLLSAWFMLHSLLKPTTRNGEEKISYFISTGDFWYLFLSC